MNFSDAESFTIGYEAFAAGRGFVRLENWSTVTLTGEDRQSFLHNMCTNDIKRLAPGDCCEAFCTDVKGKIIAHVFVIAREDRLDLVTVPEQAEGLIAHLDRYIIREDVKLADTTHDYQWMLVGKEVEYSATVKTDQTRMPGNLLGAAASELKEVESRLVDTGAIRCSQKVWEAIRINVGLPLFGIDFDSSHLPQEVNRDQHAISFNKGCYLGQETVARIDALGHVNQQVVSVQFNGEEVPEVGMDLTVAGKRVGKLTSCCWSPKLKSPLGLAMVRRGSNKIGSLLDSELGQATVVESLSESD